MQTCLGLQHVQLKPSKVLSSGQFQIQSLTGVARDPFCMFIVSLLVEHGLDGQEKDHLTSAS